MYLQNTVLFVHRIHFSINIWLFIILCIASILGLECRFGSELSLWLGQDIVSCWALSWWRLNWLPQIKWSVLSWTQIKALISVLIYPNDCPSNPRSLFKCPCVIVSCMALWTHRIKYSLFLCFGPACKLFIFLCLFCSSFSQDDDFVFEDFARLRLKGVINEKDEDC